MAQIGTINLQTQNSGVVSVPVFNTGDSGSSVHEFVRVQTASGTGFIPVVAPVDAAYPYLRVQSQNHGVVAVHNESSLGVKINDDFSTFDSNTWTLSGEATYNSSGWIDLQSGSSSYGACNWTGTLSQGDIVTIEGEYEWVSGDEFIQMYIFSDDPTPVDGSEPTQGVQFRSTFDNNDDNRWEMWMTIDDGSTTETYQDDEISTSGTHTYTLRYDSNTGDFRGDIDGATVINNSTSLRPSGQYINFAAKSGQNSGSKDLHRAAITIE